MIANLLRSKDGRIAKAEDFIPYPYRGKVKQKPEDIKMIMKANFGKGGKGFTKKDFLRARRSRLGNKRRRKKEVKGC